MEEESANPNRRQWLAAVVVGLGWTLAYSFVAPPVSLVFAWLVPGFLLVATRGKGRRSFTLGLLGGAVHYFSSLSWLLYIPVAPGNIVGWIALSGYCSVYPALWAWFCWRLFPGDRELSIGEALAAVSFSDRLRWGLSCALGWVALECLRGWVITGFPWNYLGASQLEFTPLAMFAQYTGVLGVSLVVAWVSIGGVLVAWRWKRESKFEPVQLKEVAAPAGLLVVALGLGCVAMSRALPAKRGELKIALVQPSISQTVLWDVRNLDAQMDRFTQLMELSDGALTKEPDLLVWPEASSPLAFLPPELTRVRMQVLQEQIAAQKIWRVWGVDTATNNVPFNSCALIDADGRDLAYYSKQHLVMFGEYVPLGDTFPFLKSLAPVGNFGRGTGPVVFDMGTAKTSVLICFEDVVPKLARRAATGEVDFLLNLTNDGWFGNSHQQWQHARSAAWRAIETRRPLVRCCNNGITGWIDERGRFHGVQEPVHSPRASLVTIPLREGAHQLTFYQCWGDWLPWGAVVASVGFLAFSFRRRKKGSELEAVPDK